jgi:hypothetical protein
MKKLSLFIIIIIFLILSLPDIYNPGISIDEADEAIACDFIFRNNSKLAQEVLSGYYIALFNKILPIMHGPYTGRIHAYLMFIFSRLFGVNVFSLRFSSIIISAITILFIYLLCKLWFGNLVAVITGLLTATNLFFVQYSRVGHYREVVFVICFFWAGFFLLCKYLQERKLYLLCLSFFLFGLGISTKITMLFYLIGLGITFILLKKRFSILPGMTIKQIGLALISFFLGSFNIILFNILYNGETIKFLRNSLIYPAPLSGYINLAYFSNLYERTHHFIDLLRSDLNEKIAWGVIESCSIEHIAFIFVALFFISFIFVSLYAFFSKHKLIIKYRIIFLFIFYTIVFLLTPFVCKGAHPGHLLVLIPFPQIVMALFFNYIWLKLKSKKIAICILSVFLIPFLVFNIWMNLFFHKQMKSNGGSGRWSTAIYQLSTYLKNEKIYSPVTFDCGLRENIIFLTKYRVIPNQIYKNYSLEYVQREYQRLSFKKEPIFFLTKNSEDWIPNLNLFMELAKKDGRNKEIYKVFYNRAGESVYWLYKIY